jgi:hypothetical protein
LPSSSRNINSPNSSARTSSSIIFPIADDDPDHVVGLHELVSGSLDVFQRQAANPIDIERLDLQRIETL